MTKLTMVGSVQKIYTFVNVRLLPQKMTQEKVKISIGKIY